MTGSDGFISYFVGRDVGDQNRDNNKKAAAMHWSFSTAIRRS